MKKNLTYDVKCRILFINKAGDRETREMIYRVEDWEDGIRDMLLTPMFESIDERIDAVVSLEFIYTVIN
jgi:hypothetical protein